MAFAYILIGVLIGVIVIGVAIALLFRERKKEGVKKEVDYQAFFSVGIVFLFAGIPLAISTKNPGLLGISALGAFYIILGLQHKDEWKRLKRRKPRDKHA